MLGLPPLDDILADAPSGARVALVCSPGTEGTAILMQAATKSKACAYLTLVRSPKAVRETLSEDHAIILDGYSGLVGAVDDHAIPVDPADEPDGLRKALRFVVKNQPEASLIVEGINGLMERNDDLRAVDTVLTESATFPWSLLHFVDWSVDEMNEVLEKCDAVIEMGVVEDRIISNQHIRLRSAAWTNKTFGPAVVRTSGNKARLEVPKIILSGPEGAGKTTFIQSASTRSGHSEHLGTTVGGEHGVVEHEGLRALIWGSPGQKRFDPLWPSLSRNALAGVLLVDSEKRDQMADLQRHWGRLRALGVPLVVIANKQDVDGAMEPDEIRKQLAIPPEVPVLPCSATDEKSATVAMRTLIHNILHGGVTE